MTGECGRCGEELIARVTLNNVTYEGETHSTIDSEMAVCVSCFNEMENDDRWQWTGKGE